MAGSTTEKQEKKLQEKLNEAMEDMKTPKKTAMLKYGGVNFPYAPLDSVMKEVKTALQKQGLTLYQKVEYTIKPDNNVIFLLATYVSDGVGQITLDHRPMQFTGTPQQVGAQETYYKRYALNTAFCLTGEADTDGNADAQNEDDVSKLRGMYNIAVNTGVPKEALDNILKGYKKKPQQMNDEELNEVLCAFEELINETNQQDSNVLTLQ